MDERKDDEDAKIFAIKVQAIRVDWIINSP